MLNYKTNFLLALLFILPTGIDGFFQYIGTWKSTNSRRFSTGLLAGIGVIFIFVISKDSAYNIGKELGLYFKN